MVFLAQGDKYCTGQAITHELKFWSAPPLFLEDEDIFSKIGSRGCTSTPIYGATTRADF
jgi:hypothetical protein